MNHKFFGQFLFSCCLVWSYAAELSPAQGQTLVKVTRSKVVQHAHPHYESQHHPTTLDASRFQTSRTSGVKLPLPEKKDAFTFAVFGDRTGGPPEGIEILKQAVVDVNLFEPDLVMTVGDLIQGYSDTEAWLPQMREYKSVMNKLLCPWFPVAGNHDIYWRGEGRPKMHHEEDYELHFGPLWYAFEHKGSWFITLYSDEGDPVTGEKSFEQPDLQRMSPEQFKWLKSVLAKAKDADHIFVFLHHPRWLGGRYGDDWQKVHESLVETGNVRAVFAGHIHRMRYDGPRDGIEYVTLATVGGGQSGLSERGGFLHHYNLVTVRKQQIAMACLPVGEVIDLRKVTGKVSEDIQLIASTPPSFPVRPVVARDDTVSEAAVVELFNPCSEPVEFEITLDPDAKRWICEPDHFHCTLYSGQRKSVPLRLKSLGGSAEATYEAPSVQVRADYLAAGARFAVKERSFTIPLTFDLPQPKRTNAEIAVEVGKGKYLTIDDLALSIPDGPMTLECWCKANSFSQRVGLITKTRSSEYGLFVNGGIPYFAIHLDGNYVQPTDLEVKLQPGTWHHLAGVFDGSEVRTYLDGRLVAKQSARGSRTTNRLPLIIGGDVDGAGSATSPFDGMIDAIRVSTVARYLGESFEPSRRPIDDGDTALLLNFDTLYGPLTYDESKSKAHARLNGKAKLQAAD